jgi:hypothetical protein
MRKKREFTEGTYYHVTSRTNDKIRVFENKLGRKIMLITLQDAKDKFRFRLANFCIMPTYTPANRARRGDKFKHNHAMAKNALGKTLE